MGVFKFFKQNNMELQFAFNIEMPFFLLIA